ncbi:MAG: carbohydrate binding family 9 domain-containing protein [Bacteroidota bacterium]
MTFFTRILFLSSYFSLFFVVTLMCQDAEIFPPSKVKRAIESKKIEKSIRIDGMLNEEEWKNTPANSSFLQIEPNQGELANQQTFLRVLYNKQYLYFGIFASDSLGKKAIRATDFKRDFNFNSHDLVALAFDGFNDNRNAMALTMNAYGVQRDLLSFDDLYYDSDWDGLWRVRTNRTDSGWYAEVAVPWQTLRYPKLTDSIQQWGFNMIRVRRSTNET